MTCRELVALVTDYLEDVLPPAERRQFEAHLARCANCRAYLAEMETTIRLLGRIELEALDGRRRQRLRDLCRAWLSWQVV